MSGTVEDVIVGGEDRPSEDGGLGMLSDLHVVRKIARSMKALTGLDWSKVDEVGRLYGDEKGSPEVAEMISRMGSPIIDGDRLRSWLNGSSTPDFGVRSKNPNKPGTGRGAQYERAVAPLKNAVAKLDRRKAAVRVAMEGVRRAEEAVIKAEQDVSNAALLERSMAEYSFLAEVAETAKPLFSLGVGWAFLKCLAMRDPLVPKDPKNPEAKHDYDPTDDVEGPYAYGYQDMFQRVKNEGLGDEIRVIQVVMHHARNDRFFQATVKQELFSICVRRYADAVADYRGLSAEHVHGVSPDIGDDEVIRVLVDAMKDLSPLVGSPVDEKESRGSA